MAKTPLLLCFLTWVSLSPRFTVCVPVWVSPLPALSCPVLQGPFLPGYSSTPDEPQISYGLQRLDHAVGNVHKLVEALEHIIGFTGQQQQHTPTGLL